jgi:uncharacterized protein (TIGR03084 family)
MHEICQDLAAEHDALDAVLAPIDEAAWSRATAADGWDVKDTVHHIAYFDDCAREAVVDPDGFQRRMMSLLAGEVDHAADAHADTGAELLARWRAARHELETALAPLDPKARIAWFGPPMSARSFATARLMEAWSHGRDVADALGARIEPSDRIRHIAHLGVVTRGWSYVNRGLAPNEVPVRVELLAPSGAMWTWGPEDAADRVSGAAEDFCLVVTQRRSIGDVGLDVEGEAAEEWMRVAQAFAGPPTLTPADRSGSL